ncbi:hypothetical protein [Escherichia coli]|nr:hypothetical protein [Escherichia coli]MCW7209395.1 hypothetical protein [Escherichia coli]
MATCVSAWCAVAHSEDDVADDADHLLEQVQEKASVEEISRRHC